VQDVGSVVGSLRRKTQFQDLIPLECLRGVTLRSTPEEVRGGVLEDCVLGLTYFVGHQEEESRKKKGN